VDEFDIKANFEYSSEDKKMNSQKWYTMTRYARNFKKNKKWYWFGKGEIDHDKFADIYYDGCKIYFKKLGWGFDASRLFVFGLHNVQNVMASVLLLEDIVKPNLSLLENFLVNFKGLEHRLELVREINGVKYLNDSKSTNIDSTEVALKSFEKNVVLLLGGIHKGYSFQNLTDLIKPKVKKLILFGEAKERIADELKEFNGIIEIQPGLKAATESAYKIAVKGDVVLLSPGCSSFDEFQNFEHRGKMFKQIVNNL